MSFVKRAIDVTITLGEGTFGDTVGDTVTLRGHRVTFQCEYVGGKVFGRSNIRIYGLPLDMINRLTTIGPVATQILGQNKVQVAAGDEGGQMSTVFNGAIYTAYGQFEEAPDVPLVISAFCGLVQAVKPVGASSYIGAVDAADCMADFAKEMGYSFENNGVSVPLFYPYFAGTAMTKVRRCAKAARIKYSTDNETLAIWPSTGARRQDVIPVISPDNGMIGYPIFGSGYLYAKCLFRPELIQGGLFKIEGSEVAKANSVWSVKRVTHSLASQMPNGDWFTEVVAFADLSSSP